MCQCECVRRFFHRKPDPSYFQLFTLLSIFKSSTPTVPYMFHLYQLLWATSNYSPFCAFFMSCSILTNCTNCTNSAGFQLFPLLSILKSCSIYSIQIPIVRAVHKGFIGPKVPKKCSKKFSKKCSRQNCSKKYSKKNSKNYFYSKKCSSPIN